MNSTWPGDEWPSPTSTPELNWVTFADQAMFRPVMRSQATYSAFAELAELERHKILPTFQTIAVKAFIPSVLSPAIGEYMFLEDLQCEPDSVVGNINADSKYHPDLTAGATVRVHRGRICDWFLVSAEGHGVGGFTMALVLDEVNASLTEQDQRDAVIEAPPFSWFRYRESLAADDQLAMLPPCPACGRRNLLEALPGHLENRTSDESCSLCTNKLSRTKCAKCSVPILRNADMPDTCYGCANERPKVTWSIQASDAGTQGLPGQNDQQDLSGSDKSSDSPKTSTSLWQRLKFW